MFILDEDLNKDCIAIVPRRNDTVEVFDLLPDEQQQLWTEVSGFSQLVKENFKADKINIGALGNMVSQLHIHIIARYKVDATWPQSVWDKLPAKPYELDELDVIKKQLHEIMPITFSFKSSI